MSFAEKSYLIMKNEIFCNAKNHRVHSNCKKLSVTEVETLCIEEDDVPWFCKHCLLKTLPFSNCTVKIFNSLFMNKTNPRMNLNPSYLNNFFCKKDTIYNDENLHNQVNTDDKSYLVNINNDYELSQDMHRTIFKSNVNPNCSLILMHINVRSLAKNCDKLKFLLSSMKLKPHIISLNETWLKQNQMGECNNLLDYVFITNSRKQGTGGGVGFYIKQNLSYCISDKYSIMNDKIFESLFVDIFLNTGSQRKDKFTIGTIYRSPN